MLFGVTVGIIAFTLLVEYAPPANFSLYHFAYQPDNTTLQFISPLYPLILTIAPQSAEALATFLSIGAYFACAYLILMLLPQIAFSQRESLVIVLIWLLSWPALVSFRSPSAIAFLLVLTAIRLDKTPWLAGLLAGLAPLFAVESLMGTILVGLMVQKHRYWLMAVLPLLVWGIVAVIAFEDVLLRPALLSNAWQNLLWIGLFSLSVLFINRHQSPPLVWLFVVWGAVETLGQLISAGGLAQVNSLPLSLAVAIGLVLDTRSFKQRNPAYAVALGAVLMLAIVARPSTPAQYQTDLVEARTIPLPPDVTVAHNRTAAFSYGLGTRPVLELASPASRQDRELVQSDDLVSLLVKHAPDYVVLAPDTTIDFALPSIAALRYESIAPNIWQRMTTMAALQPRQPVNLMYRPDVAIRGYRTSPQRITPGETLRVGLDWRIENPPAQGTGLNLSLVDGNGQAAASIFPVIEAERLQSGTFSTYHALTVPEDIPAGLYTLNLHMEYRAGSLGTRVLTTVVVPPETEDAEQFTLLNQIGPMALYNTALQVQDDILHIETKWGITTALDDVYQPFTHLSTQADLQPIRQDDRPISFPTRFWLPNEVITIHREVSISDLPPGDYQINMGWFNENRRLSDSDADYWVVAAFSITADGQIITAP